MKRSFLAYGHIFRHHLRYSTASSIIGTLLVEEGRRPHDTTMDDEAISLFTHRFTPFETMGPDTTSGNFG